MEILEQFPCHNHIFSKCWFILKASWSHLEPVSSTETSSCLFPVQGQAFQFSTFAVPLCWFLPKPPTFPWTHFCGRSPSVSQGLKKGQWGPLGTAHQSPTFRVICKQLLEGAWAWPLTGCSCYSIVCRAFAFSQLTCLWVRRCEKLETKLVSAEWEGLSCTERKEIPLWDLIFFRPLHPKNTKRLSVLNASVGFKSFRFGLTLQKKKKIWQAFRYDAEKLFSSQFMLFICKAKGWWAE